MSFRGMLPGDLKNLFAWLHLLNVSTSESIKLELKSLAY